MNALIWAAYSPDLNLIENVWAWMKEWLDFHYNIAKLSPDALQEAIQWAWEAIPEDYLARLALSIVVRLKKVIEVEGRSMNC